MKWYTLLYSEVGKYLILYQSLCTSLYVLRKKKPVNHPEGSINVHIECTQAESPKLHALDTINRLIIKIISRLIDYRNNHCSPSV